MANFEPLRGPRFRVPGNGSYRISPGLGTRGPASLTIVQDNPAAPLSGSLIFTLGGSTMVIDLAAGDRFRELAFPAMLYMEAVGMNPADEFEIEFRSR